MLSAAGWLSPITGRPSPAKGIRLVPVRPADAKDDTPSQRSSSVQGNHEELFADIRQGTSGWQHRAFLEFHGLVRGLIVKCFGPAYEAEELVDDVFLRFFESAKRIRSADRVQSYIVSITMNCVRSELRQRKRAALTASGDGSEVNDRPSRDDPKAKAALIQLGGVINELDPEERAVFILRTVQGMPLVEVAEVLGISLSTAHRRVRRATDVVMKRVQRNALLCDYVLERGGKLR